MGAATPFTALTAERWLRMLALSAALCLGPAIAAANGVGNAPASQRFTLNAQLSPSNVSDDGRYVIHANMRPTPQPVANAGRFARRFVQYKLTELINQSDIFGDTDEHTGRHQAARRMPPPAQGLEARHGPRLKVHDRLIEGLDLAAQKGVAQVGFQRETRQAVGL